MEKSYRENTVVKVRYETCTYDPHTRRRRWAVALTLTREGALSLRQNSGAELAPRHRQKFTLPPAEAADFLDRTAGCILSREAVPSLPVDDRARRITLFFASGATLTVRGSFACGGQNTDTLLTRLLTPLPMPL